MPTVRVCGNSLIRLKRIHNFCFWAGVVGPFFGGAAGGECVEL